MGQQVIGRIMRWGEEGMGPWGRGKGKCKNLTVMLLIGSQMSFVLSRELGQAA